jgi:hypothetical protein
MSSMLKAKSMPSEIRLNIKEVIASLDRTPRVLRVLMTGAPEVLIDQPYGPGTWTAREVVAHLIYGEQTDWMPRLERILDHGESVLFEPFDRAGHKDLLKFSLEDLLDLFEGLRRDSLADLKEKRLTSADLRKTGRHPALGVVTVSQLLATWVVHDLNHIAQVCKAMAFQLRADVGPWEQYLSILGPPSPR